MEVTPRRPIVAAHGSQLAGHFLIDRHGIVRWAHVEAAARITDIGRFPTDDEILSAAVPSPAERLDVPPMSRDWTKVQ